MLNAENTVKMIPAFFRGFFQLIRFVLNFSAPTKAIRNVDEICRQLEILQLDFSNSEEVSAACVYLADPHKLPGPAKDANNNASKRESKAGNEISQQYFHNEKTDERNQSNEQYEVDDMSISSDSDFEQTLQNHFQYTPRIKTSENVESNWSSTCFTSSLEQQNAGYKTPVSVNFAPSFEFNASFSQERNFSSRDVVEIVNTSKSEIRNSKRRKRQITNNRFDESSPVQQFCSNSLVASTPLSTKSRNEDRRRLIYSSSAVRSKMRELKQRTFPNSSEDGIDSMNTISFKDEAIRREQDAIAKHVARIRTSNSKLGLSKEALLSCNNTRYYSMSTSFGSNDSTSFS